MRIAIGSDHAGLAMKDSIGDHLAKQGHDVIDEGTNSEESVDYPDYARAVAGKVGSGVADRGVLVCGSGVGMAIAANKVAGVRAAACYTVELARLSRQHNNTNVLSLGERLIDDALSVEIVDAWLETEFEAGRHERRVRKIMDLDSGTTG